jgi:hypothetical protein
MTGGATLSKRQGLLDDLINSLLAHCQGPGNGVHLSRRRCIPHDGRAIPAECRRNPHAMPPRSPHNAGARLAESRGEALAMSPQSARNAGGMSPRFRPPTAASYKRFNEPLVGYRLSLLRNRERWPCQQPRGGTGKSVWRRMTLGNVTVG